MTEISGPGVAFECSAQNGMHVNEDHFIAEVINPKTGEVLPDGEKGELVFTSITKEAFPLMRYRTRDICILSREKCSCGRTHVKMTKPDGEKGELVFTSITKEAFPLMRYRTRDICILSREKCSCGRTHVKMTKPLGRSDDMLIVKGVNVFPSQIETVLMNKGYPANYQIIVDRINNSDTIEVQVEMTPEMFSDSLSAVAAKEKELVDALKAMLGIYAKVKLVNPKAITRSEGKAVRVIDKRNLYQK